MSLRRWIPLLASALAFPFALGADDLPRYRDPRLPADARARDLIRRMTTEEKLSQLLSNSPAIRRLGLRSLPYWNEGLHGVAGNGPYTVFPQAIGMAASWNPELVHRVATAISDEGRALYNASIRRGDRWPAIGLNFFSPNINLFRDPRWGRGQETYGEDPFLTSRFAVAFIRGIQGDHPRFLKMAATAKHFAVHSGPEAERNFFDADVGDRDLRESYLPAFQAAVEEAGVAAVMCAYNRVRGEPACASDLLLRKVLRGEWKFKGYVVSDCAAIRDIWKPHGVAGSMDEAAALALQAGTNLDCGHEYYDSSREHPDLRDALRSGRISEADLDRALEPVVATRVRLGELDPPASNPYNAIPLRRVDSPEHRQLALETARQSLVLLKNEGGLLPLDPARLKRVAVIGPNAAELKALLGNYNGLPSRWVTGIQGVRDLLVGSGVEVTYARGSELQGPHFEPVPRSALEGIEARVFERLDWTGPSRREPAEAIGGTWRGDPSRFSVRWTARLKPARSGRYRLGGTAHLGFRLWLDGRKLVDNVGDQYGHRKSAEVELEAGRSYELRYEFAKDRPDGLARLEWSHLESSAERAEAALRQATEAARRADVALVFAGLSSEIEGEEKDRAAIELPEAQERLLRAVSAGGKPVVLILMNGGPVASVWAERHVPAILEAWYPGEEGGTAIARALFGRDNPAGRLPVSVPRATGDLPGPRVYSMERRGYRRPDPGKPLLYAFGHGLSYTKFVYSGLRLERPRVAAGQAAALSVEVANRGPRDGEEVVQAYLGPAPGVAGAPSVSLAAFARVRVPAGESRRVRLEIPAERLLAVSGSGERSPAPGRRAIWVGGSLPALVVGSDRHAEGEPLRAELEVLEGARR